jgi:hypothetical protein
MGNGIRPTPFALQFGVAKVLFRHISDAIL